MQRFIELSRRARGRASVLRDERGLTTVEYVIILMLIAIMAVTAWNNFGGAVKKKVEGSTTTIEDLGPKDTK